MAAIYDRFMEAGEAACVGRWRSELLANASGRVLEVGAGTGLNLDHYGPAVNELVMCEPDRHMRRKLVQRVQLIKSPIPLEVSDAVAERLPFEDGSFDTVVSTLVLCSVDHPASALAEIHRVLRPGGSLVFLEHVADEDPRRLAWQRRIEPMWKHVAGNCHLQRRTCHAIQDAGFTFETIEHERMPTGLPFVRSTIRGMAARA